MTKRTRQMLVGAALFGWVLYLGWRFFTWLDMEGGREKLESLQKR
jgi:hypothetical protein